MYGEIYMYIYFAVSSFQLHSSVKITIPDCNCVILDI